MNAKDIMSPHVTYCMPETPLAGVAKMMCEQDCGVIPVVEDIEGRHVVGMVTDRDIVCRVIAQERNPLELKARDCMSLGIATVRSDADIDDVCDVMETVKVRRVPVIDEQGSCIGIISQADVALHASDREVAEVLREVSMPVANRGIVI